MSDIAHWILLSAEVRIAMLVRRKSSQSQLQRLFPFERVFDAANGVLNLPLYLVGLALRLQLGVTDRPTDNLLLASRLFNSSRCPLFHRAIKRASYFSLSRAS